MRDECSDVAPVRKAGVGRVAVALALVAALAPCPARADAPTPDDAPMAAPVPDALLARAASFDPATRVGAIADLRDLATPGAWSLVLAMLQRDVDPRVRASAAAALGASHDPELAAALAYAAEADPAPAVRAAAEASGTAVAPFAKRPKAAAAFSLLCPGCGYFYLKQPDRALGFLGATAALVGAGFAVLEESPRDADGRRDGGRSTPLFMAAQNTWFYGIYASYRDARLARGDLGARYPVAKEQLGDLLLAPFNPRVLKSPWVWGGLPLMLGAAVGASYLIARASAAEAPAAAVRTLGDGGGVTFFGRHYGTASGVTLGEMYNASIYLPVGVGEEALFRGVVQAGLSETPLGLWGGWAVGSAIFGAAHTFNFIGERGGARTAALTVPYLAVTGSYLGFVYVHSGFSLLQGAALHFWYDFALSTISFVADPDNQPFVARFAMPF